MTETPKRRWPRAQRFLLAPSGVDAEAAYRATISASRGQEGRASFDTARATWAVTMKLEPDDGMYLGELASGPKTIEQLTLAVDGSGHTRKQVQAALERLLDAKLIEGNVPQVVEPLAAKNPWYR